MADAKKVAVLTGKNAAYGAVAATIADTLLSLFKPEYVGMFGNLFRALAGG